MESSASSTISDYIITDRYPNLLSKILIVRCMVFIGGFDIIENKVCLGK